jgi:hypothetical protein
MLANIALSSLVFLYFWKKKQSKYKCLNENCKAKCKKLLQYDFIQKHCIHCGCKHYNNKKVDADGKLIPTPAGKEIWEGEDMLEKFHLRSVLQCQHCKRERKKQIHNRRKYKQEIHDCH